MNLDIVEYGRFQPRSVLALLRGIIMHKMKYVVGIDEAGRGPLAGPVAIGAVMIPHDFHKQFFIGIKDSKKLLPADRELWFELAQEARRLGNMDFTVSLISEKVIDRRGIVWAIRLGIKRCFKKLGVASDAQIFLDGSLKAPDAFIHQTTVIRGDEKIPVISLASICAKVVRDRKMVRLAKKFPEFDFHLHKGYGSLRHIQAIRKYGLTEIHRRSFLKKLT